MTIRQTQPVGGTTEQDFISLPSILQTFRNAITFHPDQPHMSYFWHVCPPNH